MNAEDKTNEAKRMNIYTFFGDVYFFLESPLIVDGNQHKTSLKLQKMQRVWSNLCFHVSKTNVRTNQEM